MDDDEGASTLSRDQQRMRQFLAGTLHLNNSMYIQRNGQKISLALQSAARKELKRWWQENENELHPSQRRVLVQLIVYDKPVPVDYQLVRDLSFRRPPWNCVRIKVTPAAYIGTSKDENKRFSDVKKKCQRLPGAPTFYLQDIPGRQSDKNLLQFIQDTVSFKREMDRKKAERDANIRPFITPRVDPTALPKLVLPPLQKSSMWYEQEEKKQDSFEHQHLVHEAQRAAWQAMASQQSKREGFNDDLNRQQVQRNSNQYNPTVLLSQFNLPLSQQSTTDSVTSNPQLSISMTAQTFPSTSLQQ